MKIVLYYWYTSKTLSVIGATFFLKNLNLNVWIFESTGIELKNNGV